jgi:hypothetical protein
MMLVSDLRSSMKSSQRLQRHSLRTDCAAIDFMGSTNDYEQLRSRNVGVRP